MSILILLGILCAMAWAIQEMKTYFVRANQSRQLIWLKSTSKFSEMLKNALALSITMISPKVLIQQTLIPNHSDQWSKKDILQLCLSPVSFWWIVVVGFLFTNVNPSFFFVLWLPVFVIAFSLRKIEYAKAFGFFVLFSLLAEYFGKNLTMITELVENSEIIFFTTDSRWMSLALIFVLGFLVSYFYKNEGLLSILSLFFVNRGWLSMNGAWILMLADFYGSLFSVLLPEYFNAKKINLRIRENIVSELMLFSGISMGLAVLFYSILRSEFVFVLESGLFGSHRSLELLAWSVLFLFVQFVVLMSWGHFKSLRLNLK